MLHHRKLNLFMCSLLPRIAAWAIVAIAASVVAPVQATNYSSIQLVSDGNPLTDDLGRANDKVNAVPIRFNALTTVGNYQFISYYQGDGKLLVGRRPVGADTWDLFRTQFTANNINDDHDVSSIAIDGDGFLHMSWGMHATDFFYTKSTASVLNANPINLIGGNTGNSAALNSMTGLYNTSVTYPAFYNLPDGDLLFMYRNGSSGSGDYRLRRYDTATDQWSELGAGANQIWIGRQDPGSSLPDVNAYPNALAFDSQGNIHATWTWRTSGASYETNHNIMYARSPDGGATWTTMNGTPYTTPIYETNAQVAVAIPENNSLINTTGMAVDNFNQPVVASWWAPGAAQGNNQRQYMLAWYDNGQQQWRTSQISHRTSDNPNVLNEDNTPIARPIVVVDDSNRVIVAYRDSEGTNGVTIAYSENTNRNDWKFVDITTADLGSWEPVIDNNRWNKDRVLSFLYQPTGLGQTSSPVSVLEWDSKKFFYDLHAPKLTMTVNRDSGAVTIQNGTGAPVAIDGYSISSPSGSLSVGNWHSLHDQGNSQWQEANPTTIRLNEVNPFGSLSIGTTAALQLGSAFVPSATTLPQALKQEDVAFEYTTPSGDVRNGIVQYAGFGNLVVIVDPITGNAVLKNGSQFNVGLEAYTIQSDSGSLLFQNGNWTSLADQGAAGGDWQEADVSANRLSELKYSSYYQFAKGATLSLGHLFNASSNSRDLNFQFFLQEGSETLTGIVVYQIPGDFNNDNVVNVADYLVWRKGLGTTYTQSDFDIWRAHFGSALSGFASGSGASVLTNAAVPEPATLLLLSLAASLVFTRVRRAT
jgi:BNR repeat-containing family member